MLHSPLKLLPLNPAKANYNRSYVMFNYTQVLCDVQLYTGLMLGSTIHISITLLIIGSERRQ